MGIAGGEKIVRKQSTSGRVTVGGKTFHARSSWEANIAAWFQFLKCMGQIKDWEFEPETFWFEKIKRGVRSYLPDFRITRNDDSIYYVEVKGWMDDKSRTKLKRMKKYYPHIELDLIDAHRYAGIAKQSSLYPEWGKLNEPDLPPDKLCAIDGCYRVVKDRGYCASHHKQIYGDK